MAQKINLDEIARINAIEDRALKVFSAATWYAANGFYIVPLVGKKLPPKGSGVTYSHATKNQAQIEKWFGKNGKFRGNNIGLACGMQDGIFAVDIDVHDEKKNGYETLALLEKEHGILQAPSQATPSGGRHYVYQWDEHGHSSAGKIGAGIDTRGGEEIQCKSHIVGWPSRVNGIDYIWEQGGDIPTLPEWVGERLGTPWKADSVAIGTGRGNEEVGESDEERKYSIEQVKNLLDHVDPNTLSYDQWLWTGQAIHSQHPTQEAFEMWDTWSQQGERYQPNECGVRWHAFNEGGRIRMGTLIHFAKEGGWLPPTMAPSEGSEFKDLIDELNHDFAMIMLGGKARVLIERHKKPDINELAAWYEIADIRDVQIVMANDKVAIEDDKGKVKMISKVDIWLGHERRRTYENGLIFAPGREKEIDGYFNVWRGFAYEAIEGDWSLFKGHLLDIVCDGNVSHYDWLMDWMADGVQDPMNVKGTCVVMSGIEGCGKGTFSSLYGSLFGSHYKHVTNEDHLTGKFNAQLMDASVVFADEVTFGGNRKVAGTLKAFVSEKQLTCERKGIDAFQYRNCARLIIASNESWFIPAGPQSRRWFVMAVSGEKANDKPYFTAIHKQMETQGGMEAMLHELMQRKITSDLSFAPVTELLEEQRSRYSTTESIVEWWAGCIEDGLINCPNEDEFDINNPEGNDWPDVVDKVLSYSVYEEWAMKRGARRQAKPEFGRMMKKYGWSETRVGSREARVRKWKVPPLDVSRRILKEVSGITIKGDDNEES